MTQRFPQTDGHDRDASAYARSIASPVLGALQRTSGLPHWLAACSPLLTSFTKENLRASPDPVVKQEWKALAIVWHSVANEARKIA